MVSLADVVPQPLSQMELAGPETLAKTTGSARKGTEDALLGEPGNFAWITRWVGGDKDGLVEVRCPGDSGNVPGLALTVDQFGSTLAALNAADEMHIDFAEVAKRSVAAMSKGQPTDLSFGFLTCDTEGVDLSEPQVGRIFSCVVEVYAPEGKGGYQATYRVTSTYPFFDAETRSGPATDNDLQPSAAFAWLGI